MSIALPAAIFNLHGQVVKKSIYEPDKTCLIIQCRRDRRRLAIDPLTGKKGTVNRYVRRSVKDIPMLGSRCVIEIELAEVRNGAGARRIERCHFVEKGSYYTNRFCKLISGVCRHMSIQSVAKHFALRWDTVKNMDKRYLQSTLPTLTPSELKNLMYIGVDEVARSKGHDYMTVVYDLCTGKLIWVYEGRTAKVFSKFLKELPETTKQGVLAVAMDMGPAYQKSVREELPNADIIFDRFHVMQNFSKAMDNQRRVEFRKSDEKNKKLIKGSRFLLLKNKNKLTDIQKNKLNLLLTANENISAMYILKEQLQSFWSCKTFDEMTMELDAWCDMANETNMIYMKKFARLLQRHKVGICNYAKHPLTTARIEAGNVGIGMIRKRARGIHDTEYFKLKIRQLSIPEDLPLFYDSGQLETQ